MVDRNRPKGKSTWVHVAVMHDGKVLREPHPFTFQRRCMANLIIEYDSTAMSLVVRKNRYEDAPGLPAELVHGRSQVTQAVADKMVDAHIEMVRTAFFSFPV